MTPADRDISTFLESIKIPLLSYDVGLELIWDQTELNCFV